MNLGLTSISKRPLSFGATPEQVQDLIREAATNKAMENQVPPEVVTSARELAKDSPRLLEFSEDIASSLPDMNLMKYPVYSLGLLQSKYSHHHRLVK